MEVGVVARWREKREQRVQVESDPSSREVSGERMTTTTTPSRTSGDHFQSNSSLKQAAGRLSFDAHRLIPPGLAEKMHAEITIERVDLWSSSSSSSPINSATPTTTALDDSLKERIWKMYDENMGDM